MQWQQRRWWSKMSPEEMLQDQVNALVQLCLALEDTKRRMVSLEGQIGFTVQEIRALGSEIEKRQYMAGGKPSETAVPEGPT